MKGERIERLGSDTLIDRRGLMRRALSLAIFLALPIEKAVAQLDELSAYDQLQWFQNVLGKQGGLWQRLDSGDFSGEQLRRIFAALANVTTALNDKKARDPRIRSLQEGIPGIEDVRHIYTLSSRGTDGTWIDWGNVQALAYDRQLYIQSSKHVIDVIGTHSPEFREKFIVPKPRLERDPEPDVAFGFLSRVPIVDERDTHVPEVPTDFDTRLIGGQINTTIGYKDDGGIIRHAGLVFPTPRKTLERIWPYLQLPSPETAEAKQIYEQMMHGGLMLMPRFFSETIRGSARAAGRSGTPRFVKYPPTKLFVPASNVMMVITNFDVHGYTLGYVDSASHMKRGLEEASALRSLAKPDQFLNPLPVAGEPGVFQIAPNVYLRSIYGRPATPAQKPPRIMNTR